MAMQHGKPRFQQHLGRTNRPLTLTLDCFQSFQKAANVYQNAAQFRPDSFQRTLHPYPACKGDIGQFSHAACPIMPARPGLDIPARRNGRHERPPREISAQALARTEFILRNKGAAIGVPAPIKHGKWGFRRIDLHLFARLYLVCLTDRGGG
ncbi:hypothetical protein DK59_2857 [Brucella abortus bv. 4 str. 292]|nr:hypothetical protein DK59_2857 [Brucella abortus bv. 4 str. 292]